MKVLAAPDEMLREALIIRASGRKLGFVPTMGALHEGHLALIREALQVCDVVAASIFVNPAQFNRVSDFDTYPRTIAEDIHMLEQVGCHLLFMPGVQEMYPIPSRTTIAVGLLDEVFEGRHRPGHFSGVALVVVKLFHLVQPTHAFFGSKDLQQVAVVRQIVQDFSLPVAVVECPTLRESDGLAMSSRNQLLSPEARPTAPFLYRALLSVKDGLKQNAHYIPHKEILELEAKGFKVEYLEVVHKDTFTKPGFEDNLFNGNYHVVVAAWLEEVRLIDNVSLIQ
jgi:pantoate--beta-alanine ligase